MKTFLVLETKPSRSQLELIPRNPDTDQALKVGGNILSWAKGTTGCLSQCHQQPAA